MIVTAAEVATWARLGALSPDDEAQLQLVVDAVEAHLVERYYIADPPTAPQRLAAMMAASRLWRRRDTPEGVAVFDQMGAVRVSSVDGDVRQLLTVRQVFG